MLHGLCNARTMATEKQIIKAADAAVASLTDATFRPSMYLWLYEATYQGTLTRGGVMLPSPCSLNKFVECLAHWRSAAMEKRIAAFRRAQNS
jgi:hypothetical protein